MDSAPAAGAAAESGPRAASCASHESRAAVAGPTIAALEVPAGHTSDVGPLLCMRETETSGRGLWTTQAIDAGVLRVRRS